MLTLAVDTTAEFGSIALADEDGVRDEILLHEPKGFSGVLFHQIELLLARQEIRLEDIELFAGASGPGSFTGVRIGLAAIKGLGEVLEKPVIAVSNLEALAASFATGPLRATVIDARRGEIYGGAVFDSSERTVVPEMVVRFPKFLELLENREFEWVSNDFDPFRGSLTGTRFENCRVTVAPRALAAAIARLAHARFASGVNADSAGVEANYVRRSDAELLWK